MKMNKKKAYDYFKRRWQTIHKIEVEELKKTSLKEKLKQISSLFDLAKQLRFPFKKNELDTRSVMARWKRLKNYYSEAK